MKGAVDLITIIIVACIVVSIGLMLWFYLSVYYWQVSQAGGARTQRSLETLSSCMRIEEATQNKFFIRNCGTGLVTNDSLNVYIDDNRFSFSLDPASIDAGKTGTLSLQGASALSIGQHTLRITNPNVETSALFTAELPDSCVMDLEFDESSGTIAHDSSGNGNDGTLYNNPLWVDGKYGKALSFDGINDYVNVSDSNSLDVTSAITVSAWIYPTSWPSTYPRILSKEVSTVAAPYSLELDSSNKCVLFCLDTGSGEKCSDSGINSISLNQWYYVTGIWDGTNNKIYLNGIPKVNTSQSGSLAKTANNVLIGNNPSINRQFNGTIDSVRIYNQALTPDQTLNFRLI